MRARGRTLKTRNYPIVPDRKSMIGLDLKGIYDEMGRRTFGRWMSFKGMNIHMVSAEAAFHTSLK
ncbi:MAG: hypothetical protein ACP5PX_01560 [Candidatus Hadarchaeum sp.]|uniref:hypothetical protein n=1 Tax=Candidatus Hadarchaeum sp. TaxID=2883567 RepID=UPI003D0DDB3F